MNKHLHKKAVSSAAFLLILTGLLFYGAFAQRTSLGQQYRVLSVNGRTIGATAEEFDAAHEFLAAKKAVLREQGGEWLWETSYETKTSRAFLTPLKTADELREELLAALRDDLSRDGTVLAYTVRVGDFSATFPTLDQTTEFLNQAKSGYDEEDLFTTVLLENRDQESNSVSAVLVRRDEAESGSADEEDSTDAGGTEEETDDSETVSFVTAARAGVVPAFLNPLTRPKSADYVDAGVSDCLRLTLEDAIQNPFDKRYEVGVVDVDFSVPVYVYSTYAAADAFTPMADAVAEATKEEETNKIYTVSAGDTLSQIAENYGLTLDYLMKLNEFTDSEQPIHIDQELIVAVPEPELQIRRVEGILYEEAFTANPIIVPNNDWYTTKEEVLSEGTTGLREVNAFVTYQNGVEAARTTVHTTVLEESEPEVIERGTIVPPTYIKPISGGRFTSGFGRRWGRMHKGVDWATPTGTTVFASSAGVVEYAGWGNGYGNTILIDHPDGRKTRVAHLSKILVSAGQSVAQGQTIGLSGSTGRSTGPHVHFEIYINGTQVNPLDYIN